MQPTDIRREKHENAALPLPQPKESWRSKREFKRLSNEAMTLVHGREPNWEHLLLFQVLNDDIGMYKKTRQAHAIGSGSLSSPVLSQSESVSWLNGLMEKPYSVISSLARIGNKLRGHLGVTGDAISIVRSAHRFSCLYVQVMDLSLECDATASSPAFDGARRAAAEIFRDLASQIEAFGASSISAIRGVVAASCTEVKQRLKITFTPQIDDKCFCDQMETAMKSMERDAK